MEEGEHASSDASDRDKKSRSINGGFIIIIAKSFKDNKDAINAIMQSMKNS